jgi:hypothetical protein
VSARRAAARALPLVLALVPPAARLGAQQVLAPTPVLDLRLLSPTPRLSGYISVRQTRRNDSTTFTLNRGRVTVMARPRPSVGVRIQADFSAAASGRLRPDSGVSGFVLTDAYAQLSLGDTARWGAVRPTVVVGQFRQPFSLEYLSSFAYLPTANRSQVVDRLSPKRDIGVMAQLGWRRYATLAAALSNGSGPNATANPDGKELAAARLTVTPVPWLAVAGKLANEGGDHARGYDARLIRRRVDVEGEAIHRTRPLPGGGTLDAGGGYALAAVKVLPWLQPVYKWERYREARTGGAGRVSGARHCAGCFRGGAAPGRPPGAR